MKLSVLIPIYNDRDFIEAAVAQVKAVPFPIPLEIVAVDDCSTDGSANVLRKISGVEKIFHTKNTGKGGAIKTGLQHVTGDIIAIQDDDCEYNPMSLLKLIQPILHKEVQAVYGSRFLQKNSMFLIQRLQNWGMTTLTNVLLGQKLTDVESGHKVFTKEIAQKLNLQKTGFEFDMEITLQILKLGYTIKELPTEYVARSKEQGKKITYKDGLKSIGTLVKFRTEQFFQNHS